VDVPQGVSLTGLRNVPYGIFRNAGRLLVRVDAAAESPAQGAEANGQRFNELEEQVNALELADSVEWGVLRQPVGEPAWIEGDVPEADWPDLLDRARAIEIEALLEWGDGVWRPSTYHYRLPSGEHAAGFVRVADAVQRPRDAEVLASWMHADLADRIGVVVDTGTLSSVVQALLGAIRSKGWHPGLVTVLDGYPATAFDVTRLLRDTASSDGLLTLLSVNSSGRVRDHLIDGLKALQAGTRRSLHVLVAKQEIAFHRDDAGDDVAVHTWHPRPDSSPLIRYDAESADVCELCRRAQTAVLIPISPRSFDGTLPDTLATITPAIADARRNRELWQLCNAGATISLDSKPCEDIKWRAPETMSIVINHEELLKSGEFRNAAARCLEDQLRYNRCRPKKADLVLMPEHEFNYSYRSALIKSMKEVLGTNPKVMPFPLNDEWSDDLKKAVRQADECIGVLTLGAVTGTTLHSALAAVQSARDPGPYDLYAYVLHARLSQRRTWETLENSYANLIFAAWHSYLPNRSPLQDERRTLDELSSAAESGLSNAARSFLDARRRYVAGDEPGSEIGVFWGSKSISKLTPNSIFGQSLTGPAIYAAVCSAMERARGEDLANRPAPIRRVFEMPAIVRSYYDPMILAAILRWLEPHEAWWGKELADEGNIVDWMLGRATAEQAAILLPELLLATAQGKLNRPGAQSAQAKASALLESDELTAEQKAPIELGRALVPSYGTDDELRKENQSAIARIEKVETEPEFVALMPGMLQDLQQGRLANTTRRALEDKAEELVQTSEVEA